ncbi:MAG TPA: decaprenyl-phosphate phosphoribosyltransferase [Kofleriaceae bacterium]|nr:decaprenyl-phosphate phosphoribosyltransferase [Kofleriaceae bacterium]
MIKTLRPHQWVKNVFVGAALVFSRNLTDGALLARTAVAFGAFCLISGAVYTFNDVRDVESDRAHPTKRKRPIAAGRLSERTALVAAGVLAAIALAASAVLSWPLAGIVALYFGQNIAYSVKLKHVAFVDIALIASGFLLRVLAGAVAIDVPASGWLLACTALLALFFGLGKRAHELAWAERTGGATETRAALAGYRIPVVRAAMIGLALATCVAYVAYAVDARTVREFGTDRLAYSAPFVALGILRFMFLALWYPKDEPPTEAMLKDPWFLLDLAGATAVVLYIIYG